MPEPMKIGLLGATFDTGNMGVSALAESTIKCILHRWPDAEVILLSGCATGDHRLRMGDRDLCVRQVPIRFCENAFLENHFIVLFSYALLFKVFRWEGFKRFCARRNASLNSITQMDLVADITGGDSFSDIYGMRRFILGFLRKWVVLLFKKDLIMLPQTYGPFKRPLARAMARYILRRASAIYSRDRDSLDYVKSLLNSNTESGKIRFTPDVGFVLDSREPQNTEISELRKLRAEDAIVVGLNISGLLYNGSHTRNERFGLKIEYRQLVCQIARLLLGNDKVKLLLVPHVLRPDYPAVDDIAACLDLYEQLGREYASRIFPVKGEYDQGEIKYIIGMCDFFVGSRMHACIAAMSQHIPTCGVAYSKKFQGVFESVGLPECVADARNFDEKQLLEKIESILPQKDRIRRQLEEILPRIKRDILSIFKDSNGK